eukprot:TRINITY_DN2324_c0_g1_i1.p1 TRINITY_DN2324_c0_g1~~TRINITY_DN2324_c0_g1_i1.p1  ORF type:complete len:223 (-),score=51.03 TRINITY_DN2324_c0_g1_i1:735-1403(-)
MPLFNRFGGAKTIKASKKKIPKGTLRHTLKKTMRASLGAGLNIGEVVKLPPGQDKHEWIAMNTMELFNTVDLIWDLVGHACSPDSCPKMDASSTVTYLWADGVKIKKPIDVPACKYVEYLMDWIGNQIDDEGIFPVNGKFPKTFHSSVKQILKRMFRIYAHIYYKHMDKIKEVDGTPHFLTSFRHFYFFVSEFKLVNESDMGPMMVFIQRNIKDQIKDNPPK